MLFPANFKGQIKVTKNIVKMSNGGRRNKLWLAKNQHIFKPKPKMDDRILNIHHRRLDLKAFVKESLRGHTERSLISKEKYKRKQMQIELARLENDEEVEVED